MRSAVAIAVLAALVSAKVESPIEGYEVVEAGWKIEVEAGKPPVVLKGTVQEVLAQLEADYPETAAIAIDGIAAAASAEASAVPSESLDKRDYNLCRNFPVAMLRNVEEGVYYLRGVPGRPTLNGGRGVCARVSCSYNAAIWWCNDNPNRVELASFNDIANGAKVIADDCKQFYNSAGWMVSGQRFHDNNINVIVRENSC
ncbi:hypothetical protein B0I35DRAFT_411400 [Stachybotrys elegans]|uniref:Ecp2 effector protein domain-containing protein n=1 Tax=Stachybotrys elegans TaxID=80388 RepID=A0A8K0SRD4_9HYPO|nr:hypothetical protein B0I35DRAFT_411400 [Stachybotrys elegans]